MPRSTIALLIRKFNISCSFLIAIFGTIITGTIDRWLTSDTVSRVLEAVGAKEEGKVRGRNVEVDVLKVEKRRKQDSRPQQFAL